LNPGHQGKALDVIAYVMAQLSGFATAVNGHRSKAIEIYKPKRAHIEEKRM
jgi:hypothetical protein